MKTPGQIAYDAFWIKGHSDQSRTKDGFNSPYWNTLPEDVRKGWEAAAQAVLKDYWEDQDRPRDD